VTVLIDFSVLVARSFFLNNGFKVLPEFSILLKACQPLAGLMALSPCLILYYCEGWTSLWAEILVPWRSRTSFLCTSGAPFRSVFFLLGYSKSGYWWFSH